MKIYDKVAWHVDAGDGLEEVVEKLQIVMEFLKEKDLLTKEGLELFDLGVDEEFSLHERMLTKLGNSFLEGCYDQTMSLPVAEVAAFLANEYTK